MDFIGPVIDIVSRIWNCSATHTTYLCKLKENLIFLRTSLDRLKNRRDDVKRRIDDAESNPTEPMKHTHVVDGWLQRVEALEHEVDEILQEATQQINAGSNGLIGCCFCNCSKNCWSSYKFGKLVVKKLKFIEEISSGGDFNVVVERSQPATIKEMSHNQVVGMAPMLDEIWRLVTKEDQVKIIGLYGMGGVGKITLLKKLNNEFLKRSHEFDLVVWVVVSKDLNLKKVQKDIGEK
ncbi:NB-ARC [Macleaya cordata]|uniref:NB-ARC n=1 Tax=Macleaya cordata TaxID=56857 RepID=A0A200QLQ4_MACCD|nr:NB-ARC [Macleaya cordata]